MNLKDQASIPLGKTAKRLDGQKFGLLTALRPVGRQGANVIWLCSCTCGGHKNVIAAQLRAKVRSCGCLLTSPVASTFVGPRQPREKRVNTKVSSAAKAAQALERKTARNEKKKLEKLELATSRARSRLKTAEDSGILSDEELDRISALPVQDIPRALSMATADAHNKAKQADYAYKLATYPAFAAKEEAKALRRAERREEKKAQDEAERLARNAAYGIEKQERAANSLKRYLAVADTKQRTLQQWLFGHEFPNIHSIEELNDVYKAVEQLKSEGPGMKQYGDAYIEWIITRINKPAKPAWCAALMELWYTPLTIVQHCDWINRFDYEEYEYEEQKRDYRVRAYHSATA
jgi:hypothetical protein